MAQGPSDLPAPQPIRPTNNTHTAAVAKIRYNIVNVLSFRFVKVFPSYWIDTLVPIVSKQAIGNDY
jgi:hypothetical protein